MNKTYIQEIRKRTPRRRHIPKDYIPDEKEKTGKKFHRMRWLKVMTNTLIMILIIYYLH